MIRGFYTARSGLMAHQEHMNTVANNMANANTVGFKPMRSSFADLMYQNLNRQGVEEEAMVGHGVKINKNDLLMGDGALSATDYPFDFAILEQGGFFAVEQPGTDQVRYTRAGNFQMSNEDGTFYLVTGAGERVLDGDGEAIEIPFNKTGEMEFDPSVIGVYRFPNPYGLLAAGDNAFTASETSGEAAAIEAPRIKQGYVEGSAVEMSVEMVNVIESSKAFSFNSRMVQIADEVEQTINSLR